MNKILKMAIILVVMVAVVIGVLLSPVEFGIPLTYACLAVAGIGAVVFPLIQMFGDLKKSKRTFISIGLLVLVFLISYFVSGGEDFTKGELSVEGSTMKLVEASMYAFYALMVLAIVGILWGTVSRYFK